ncbi:hypothetical protein A2U01_0069519 [Trifolium medium]|uniref:Uncharacterized protein n=1 Tax=Trifolium medium TaxID=97028 RepID=A0A392SK76_9FABA|nr:hypothetical protein [Trifolium medium]
MAHQAHESSNQVCSLEAAHDAPENMKVLECEECEAGCSCGKLRMMRRYLANDAHERKELRTPGLRIFLEEVDLKLEVTQPLVILS